jgi:hypothetical protein
MKKKWHCVFFYSIRFRLDKKQKETLILLERSIHSHWTPKTARCTVRKLNRFELKETIQGDLCRKSYARIRGQGEATLARYVASVHQSKGRASKHIHKSIGKEGHHQLESNVRSSVINFFLEIASQAGEESAGRHSRRNSENCPNAEIDVSIIFIPSMGSKRLLYRLYKNQQLYGGYASSLLFHGDRIKVFLTHLNFQCYEFVCIKMIFVVIVCFIVEKLPI